jgi:predicted Zn-dependent peptidase
MNALGSISNSSANTEILELPLLPTPKRYWHIPKADSIQTSVRIGRTMFTRNHPDYVSVFVLNTILGGYFGSRLMQNLREKKGLTYHIYSSLDTFMLDGYFLISTEVDNERYKVAVKGIYDELDKLRQKLISDRELSSIKNYLRGSFLNYFENAFGYSELIRMLSLEGGALAFDELIMGVENIQADEILRAAQKYFAESDLTEITVGK